MWTVRLFCTQQKYNIPPSTAIWEWSQSCFEKLYIFHITHIHSPHEWLLMPFMRLRHGISWRLIYGFFHSSDSRLNAECTPLKCTFYSLAETVIVISKLLSLQRITFSTVLPLVVVLWTVSWRFRESPLTSSDPSSSFSTTSKTLPLPCRCITLLHAPLDKVVQTGLGLKCAAYSHWCRIFSSRFFSAVTFLTCLLTDEFARAVYVATGLKLTRHLVNTIFKIFDVDHDDQLSYKEFIGIMKDRLHRGARVRTFLALVLEKILITPVSCRDVKKS